MYLFDAFLQLANCHLVTRNVLLSTLARFRSRNLRKRIASLLGQLQFVPLKNLLVPLALRFDHFVRVTVPENTEPYGPQQRTTASGNVSAGPHVASPWTSQKGTLARSDTHKSLRPAVQHCKTKSLLVLPCGSHPGHGHPLGQDQLPGQILIPPEPTMYLQLVVMDKHLLDNELTAQILMPRKYAPCLDLA
jgi:hypothetical protein